MANPAVSPSSPCYSWNEVNGHPINDWVAVNTAARKAVPNPLATALVPDIVKDWVDPELPTKKALQAKKKRMSYRSVAEFMSERYHCDVLYLDRSQRLARRSTASSRGIRSSCRTSRPFYVEKLTGARYEADEALSQRHVVVDTKMNQARIFEAAPAALIVAEPGVTDIQPVTRANRGLIASFPITPGQPKFIKFGTWELRNMIELPHWRYDQQLLDTGKRGKDALNIPPGPNSPVGDHLERPQQTRHRHARHLRSGNHRPRPQRRLHPPRQLGRHPPAQHHPPRHDGGDPIDRDQPGIRSWKENGMRKRLFAVHWLFLRIGEPVSPLLGQKCVTRWSLTKTPALR